MARLVAAAILLSFWSSLRADSTVSNCVESALDSALARGGHITFTCGSTINITFTKPITTDTILDASAVGGTISTTNGIRLFSINPGVSFTIIGLTLTGGTVTGADGTNGTSGVSGFGAAIFNDSGHFTAVNAKFLSNSVSGGAGGAGVTGGRGGVAQSGGSGGLAYGAAVYNLGGTVALTNCVFQSNRANGGSGGNGADASTAGFAQEGGPGGSGGTAGGAALYNSVNGTVVAIDCTFTGNQVTGASGGAGGAGSGGLGLPGNNGPAAPGNGGGIFNDGGGAVVAFSTFLTNAAAGAPGQNGSAGSFSSPGFDGSSGAAGNGGGILNLGGSVSMTNCTLFGNTVTGAAGGQGGQGGTTGFGGRGGDGAGGGAGLGGGVCSMGAGSATLVNVTFIENNATGGPGGAGGAPGSSTTADPGSAGSNGPSHGGAVAGSGSPVILKNSILAYAWPNLNAWGLITDGGNNLSSDSTPSFTASTSRNSTDPQVSNPANNGGPTLTAALDATSPAINAGNTAVSPSVDQRHYPRSGLGDIGAFEYGANPPAVRLGVRRVATDLVISWSSDYSGYTLQSSISLTPPVWTPVTTPPVLYGFDYVVTNSLGFFDRFYRLSQ